MKKGREERIQDEERLREGGIGTGEGEEKREREGERNQDEERFKGGRNRRVRDDTDLTNEREGERS